MSATPTSTASGAPSQPDDSTLRPGQLGVWAIVFFVVAAAAPLVGMTGALPPSIALGNGAAAPGGYLAVGFTLLLFSVGYAAMSHRVTNAGAFFAYIGRGLGTHAGIGASFVSILAYLAIQLALFGFFGGLLATQIGLLPWWGWSALAWVLVTGLSLCQIDVGARILGALMLLELLSLLVTSAAILVDGGPEGLAFKASFSPGAVLAGGLAGSAGITFAFAFASFIGFEATAIYGEESRDPKVAVPRATYLSVCVITAMFSLTSFAVVTGLGASKVVERAMALSTVDNMPLADPAAVMFSLARQYVGGWMATAMNVLVLSSLFAGLLAFQNSASRYFFALGRCEVLPTVFGKVNRFGAPAASALLTSAISAVVMTVFAVAKMDPVLSLFFWFSGIAVVAIVLIEILVCAAVIAFFHRHAEGEGLFTTKLAPALAAAGLMLGEYLLMSRFGLLSGTAVEGVDPALTAWHLSPLGWTLVLLPFATLLVGYAWSLLRRGPAAELVENLLA